MLSLPPPANWQDFERLCCDLWKRIWKVQHAHLNGRTGQPQHGVDVFAPLDGGARWAGVQCKRFEVSFKSKRQLEAEVEQAKKFNPSLCDFVIATTAPNDEKAQEWAREITAAQRKIGSFPVAIYGWGDLCRELAPHQDLIRLYFPDFSWPPEPAPKSAAEGTLEAVRQAYLANLYSQLERLALGVFGKSSQRVETRLHEIFVSLDIERAVGLARAKDPRGEPEDLLSRALRPRLAAEETALVQLKKIERSEEGTFLRAAGALEALAEVGDASAEEAEEIAAGFLADRAAWLGPAGALPFRARLLPEADRRHPRSPISDIASSQVVPRLAELLADTAFSPLAAWLRARRVTSPSCREQIDQLLEQVRQKAVAEE